MSKKPTISVESQEKLLNEYVLVSVEERTENKIVEKYSRDEMDYTLTCDVKDGKKHGKARLVSAEGRSIAVLTFDQGNITGHCRLCDNEGIPQFEGEMKNGVKCGDCKEFDELGRIIFEGKYVEGKKIPYFEESSDKPGFFIERSREDLHEISYTQYNPTTRTKFGQCFLLNPSSGEVEKEVYLNEGEGKGNEIVIRELKGKGMTIFDNGQVIYEGEYSGDWESGFKRHGNGKEYERGVLVYEGEFVNDDRNVVVSKCCDKNFRGYFEERTVDGELLSISQLKRGTLLKHGRSIGYSLRDEKPASEKWYEDGKYKWERIQVNGNEMTEIDENGVVVYKGGYKFLDGEFIRWGEGKEYESENVILYKGGFMNGYYHGKGMLYRNTDIYFNGNWELGYPEGEGVLFDESMESRMDGDWHLGYLKGVDYWSGEQRGCCDCMIRES